MSSVAIHAGDIPRLMRTSLPEQPVAPLMTGQTRAVFFIDGVAGILREPDWNRVFAAPALGGGVVFRSLGVAVDGSSRDAARASGHILVTTCVMQCDVDGFPLQFAQRRADLECQRVARFRECRNALWQHRKRDLFAVCKDDG